jgi:hypothetical protein
MEEVLDREVFQRRTQLRPQPRLRSRLWPLSCVWWPRLPATSRLAEPCAWTRFKPCETSDTTPRRATVLSEDYANNSWARINLFAT